jgi:hypothetical protein
MFKTNEKDMGRKDLKWCKTELAALYQNPINYYAFSSKTKQGYVKVRTEKNKNVTGLRYKLTYDRGIIFIS